MAYRIEHPNCRRAFAALPSDYEGPLNGGEPPGLLQAGGGGGSGGGRPPGGGSGDGDLFQRVEKILKPSGKLVGRPGTSKRVRMLPGGMDGARKLFGRFAELGVAQAGSSREIERITIPGVGKVVLRTISKSGHPTIDVIIRGIGIDEIKFED